MDVQLLGRDLVSESRLSFDAAADTIRSVTISLAEYRELLRKSALYDEEHAGEPRPVRFDNIKEVE